MVTTGDDNVVAVIDTGIDLDHPDLQEKVWRNSREIPANDIDDDLNGYIDDIAGWDFVNEDNVPQDDHSHGSHVAGIAAAHTNNKLGVAGVSWGAR
jgi:subtilisin family serine protease